MDRTAEAQVLMGLALDDGKIRAKQMGFIVRVTSVDGKHMMVTMDYSPDRVNFEVEQNVIRRVYIG
jgi:hypothetical protein